LSPDGRLLITVINKSGGDIVNLWDVRAGRNLHKLPRTSAAVFTAEFSPDGKQFAYGGEGGEIYLFDAITGKEKRRLETTEMLTCIRFSPEGKKLVAIGPGGSLQIWDVETGELRLHCVPPKPLRCGQVVAFSPDGKKIAHGGRTAIVIWDATTGKVIQTLPGEALGYALCFSPDGKLLACDGYDKTIWFWDVATGKPRFLRVGHQGPVRGAVFSPDGRTIFSISEDATIRRWDAVTGKELYQAGGHEGWVNQVFITPDGQTLVSVSRDSTVRWWEATTGKEVKRHDIKYFNAKIAFSQDGRVLACEAEEKQIHIWDGITGKELRVLGQQKEEIGSLAFASGSRVLISTGYNESGIQLWDVVTCARWRTLSYEPLSKANPAPPPVIAVSPDGLVLASQAKAGIVQLWEVSSGKERQRIRLPCDEVVALAFSPDGKTLAVGDPNGVIYLWSLVEGKVQSSIKPGRLAFTTHWDISSDTPMLATIPPIFSPKGRMLATIGNDTTILLWPIPIIALPNRNSTKPPEDLWTDLRSENAEKAYQAMCDLIANPAQALLLLNGHLRPVVVPDPQQLSRLLKELDSEEFAARERATEQLIKFGDCVEPAVQAFLRSPPSPESQRRADEVRKKVRGLDLTPETLRSLRAAEVLEHIGTPEAIRLLESLSNGASGARVTQEAKASVERLASLASPGK
jgi:WD40 repeat protein